MANLLPRLIVLKSNHDNGYLGYVSEHVPTKGYIHSAAVDALSPKAKFAVELAKNEGNEGLVHIRSCYNNKYWTTKSDGCGKYWIVAEADNPEEERKEPSCTLFEPLIQSSSNGGDDCNSSIIRLRHIHLGRYIRILTDGDVKISLCAQFETPDGNGDAWDLFTVIDWETLVVLPKYVAFKGDNGKYLSAGGYDNVLQFSGTDIGDPLVRFEVVPNGDGTIRLKHDNLYLHYVYVINGELHYIKLRPLENINSQLFWPIKLDGEEDSKNEKGQKTVIALRNMYTQSMCRRFSFSNYPDILSPNTMSIMEAARLVVEEPVMSRAIYNVAFRLGDARVYNLVPVTMVSQILTNETREPSTARVTLSYTTTTSSTWELGVSLTVGIKLTVTEGIPFVEDASIEMSAQSTYSFQYGRTTTTSETMTEEYETVVPPMTVVTVSKLATQGSCDVPFSYVMRDTLYDGRTVTSYKDGGVFYGVNCYQFYTDKKEVPLPSTRPAPSP